MSDEDMNYQIASLIRYQTFYQRMSMCDWITERAKSGSTVKANDLAFMIGDWAEYVVTGKEPMEEVK